MPTIAPIPDVTRAVLLKLRSHEEITALVSDRISPSWQKAWAMPTYAILVDMGDGLPPFEDRHDLNAIAQLECYGPDMRTADLLWRTVHACLRTQPIGFKLSSTLVRDTSLLGWPQRRVSEANWPYILARYVVTYSEEPVS